MISLDCVLVLKGEGDSVRGAGGGRVPCVGSVSD